MRTKRYQVRHYKRSYRDELDGHKLRDFLTSLGVVIIVSIVFVFFAYAKYTNSVAPIIKVSNGTDSSADDQSKS